MSPEAAGHEQQEHREDFKTRRTTGVAGAARGSADDVRADVNNRIRVVGTGVGGGDEKVHLDIACDTGVEGDLDSLDSAGCQGKWEWAVDGEAEGLKSIAAAARDSSIRGSVVLERDRPGHGRSEGGEAEINGPGGMAQGE